MPSVREPLLVMNRALALLIAWNLAGLLRVAAVFLIDRHPSLGLANLAHAGFVDAFFGDPYFLRSLTAAAVAFVSGEAVVRLTPRAERIGCAVSLVVFWALIAFGETLDRSNVVNMMTNEFRLNRTHFVVLSGGLLAAAATFGIWLVSLRANRNGRAIVAASVALVACAIAPRLLLGPATAAEDTPNVVLITIDTLRADHVSAYGYPRKTTPNLDALAESGTLYLNAISQAPNTHPSMAAMTASSYPTNLGGKLRYIPPGVGTVAEAFANAGYETAAVVSNVWLKDTMGFAAGFNHFDQTSAMSEFYADKTRIDWKGADLVSDAAVQWLQGNGKKPFFLWIHYLDPHHPYEPPESVRDAFTTDASEQTAYLDTVGRMPTREQTQWLGKAYGGEIDGASDKTFQAVLDLYDAEILFTDRQIGRVIDEIESMNLGDTVFAVTADHGEEFRDHDGWGHSHTLHRELVHVPLILTDSRDEGGARRSDRVRVIDLAPTLLARAGIPAPPSMMGEDLTVNAGDRDAVSVLTKQDLFSIESDNWKLVSRDYGAEVLLYDVSEDPFETVDLSAANPNVVAKLQKRLEEELGQAAKAESMDATADKLDAGTRKQLEALGYID